MHRRTRFLIGLVLLVTMSISLAETVWAATCSPDMVHSSPATGGMGDMHAMEDAEDMAAADMPAEHDCLPRHAHEPSHTDHEGMPCPFSPVGEAPGCAAAASLPAAGASISSPSSVAAILLSVAEAAPHRFDPSSVFHPPRA